MKVWFSSIHRLAIGASAIDESKGHSKVKVLAHICA
jgi:hypothetical protein